MNLPLATQLLIPTGESPTEILVEKMCGTMSPEPATIDRKWVDSAFI